MRVVTYARYSTDMQNPRSIDDQFRLCREYAANNGLTIIAEHHDAAASGTTTAGRPGLQAVTAACLSGQAQAVLCEDQDRISRDLADVTTFAKKIAFAGAVIVTTGAGAIDTLRLGIGGLVAQMEIEKTREKVRRGLTGVHEDGRMAGGKTYGYGLEAGERRGVLFINNDEAEIVNRIFNEFVAGASGRTIAKNLNTDGIPSPKGGAWRSSTIVGNAKQQTGILRNPLYDGRLIWNKRTYVRHPETGRRVPRMNPIEQWREQDVPELRIVDQNLFMQAQRRMDNPSKNWTGRTMRIFSGKIVCGSCGSGMSIVGSDRKGKRVRCSSHLSTGMCDHKRLYYIEEIERSALSGLAEEVASERHEQELREHFASEYRKEMARLTGGNKQPASNLPALKAKRSRIIDMIADGLLSRSDGRERVQQVDRDISRAQGSSHKILPVVPDTRLFAMFRQAAKDLPKRLSMLDVTKDEAVQAVRSAVEKIVVPPTPAGTKPVITVTGSINGVVESGGCGGPQRPVSTTDVTYLFRFERMAA